ncbi:hypothetical protein, partial [Salmonella enterica]|uniref:hypothetical protein n=1 Tax=Salmonella enterica TaxID=28901 RepID=UPI0009AA128B
IYLLTTSPELTEVWFWFISAEFMGIPQRFGGLFCFCSFALFATLNAATNSSLLFFHHISSYQLFSHN